MQLNFVGKVLLYLIQLRATCLVVLLKIRTNLELFFISLKIMYV